MGERGAAEAGLSETPGGKARLGNGRGHSEGERGAAEAGLPESLGGKARQNMGRGTIKAEDRRERKG